jgi:hypothetical protein
MADKPNTSSNGKHESAKDIARYEAELKTGTGKNTAKAKAFDKKSKK